MAEIVDVTEEAFEDAVLAPEELVVVNFWGPQCPWCKRLDPVYEELAEAFGDRVRFAKLNVAENPGVTTHWGIMGTPTLKFFCQGREVHEVVGFRPQDQLRQELERALEEAEACLEQSTPLA